MDVIIVGGSYAGLSAAMALGRSLRQVMVIDSGKPCNAQTPHSHNFLTQDGKTPREISDLARAQLSGYPTVSIIDDVALEGRRTASGFTVNLASGESISGRKLIFATGIRDQLPEIPGFAESWGISVIHCPYCHGYEFRGKRTAVLADGEVAMHYAPMLLNLTKDLTILTNGKSTFTHEQFEKLSRHNVKVNETKIARIEHREGYITNVILEQGQLACDALYFRPPFVQHSAIPEALGCEFTEQGYLKVDATQKTTVDGVYAAGDNCSPMRSVANAVSSGNMAGAAVNRELALEDFG